MKSSKRDQMATRVKALKAGESFTVTTASERVNAIQTAKTLHAAGVIDWEVKTFKRKDGEGFTVLALTKTTESN